MTASSIELASYSCKEKKWRTIRAARTVTIVSLFSKRNGVPWNFQTVLNATGRYDNVELRLDNQFSKTQPRRVAKNTTADRGWPLEWRFFSQRGYDNIGHIKNNIDYVHLITMYTLLTCERKFNDPTFTALVRSSAKRATKAVSENVSLSSSISISLMVMPVNIYWHWSLHFSQLISVGSSRISRLAKHPYH